MEQQIESNSKILRQREALLAFPDKRKYLVVEDDFTLQPIWEHIIRAVDPHALIRWARTEEGAERLINDRLKIEDEFDVDEDASIKKLSEHDYIIKAQTTIEAFNNFKAT